MITLHFDPKYLKNTSQSQQQCRWHHEDNYFAIFTVRILKDIQFIELSESLKYNQSVEDLVVTSNKVGGIRL